MCMVGNEGGRCVLDFSNSSSVLKVKSGYTFELLHIVTPCTCVNAWIKTE